MNSPLLPLLRRFLPPISTLMTSHTNTLSDFLSTNKARYLDALRTGTGQSWTVVVGNEAGDLDSSASSMAYSYLASTLLDRPTIALLPIPRSDLQLRAENLYAYKVAGLHHEHADILCIDDISADSLTRLTSSSFALVDHNRLTLRFRAARTNSDAPKVVSIIDHHEDEGFHREANDRLIAVPVGSCASLVTQYFMDAWGRAEMPPPKELASLLLCAIFIDTYGLKPGGKAVPIDHHAAAFLLPKSTFSSSSSNFAAGTVWDHEDLKLLIRTLDGRKKSVAHLSSRDLLRRDYKEYTYNSPSLSPSYITVGIATVPLSPREWFGKEASPKFWGSLDAWIDERQLDALGVLCTYSSPSGQHKRQNLWVVKGGLKALKEAIWAGLETCEELSLQRRNLGKKMLSEGMDRETDGDIRTASGSVARIWKQGNTKATRKVIAPLVKKIIEVP